MSIHKELFGVTSAGVRAYTFELSNSHGMKIVVSNYGVVLQKLFAPDKNGQMKDVVLGYDHLEDYEADTASFGATVGRVANRIGGASFTLNGKTYELDKNDGKNCLHSGFQRYNKRVWEFETEEDEDKQSVSFHYVSPDMDQGMPGEVKLTVRYTLTEEDEVQIHYMAKSDQDTILNLTNHSYFNLAGHDVGDVMDQIVWIDAEEYIPADEEHIPHGIYEKVEGTPMDFRVPKPLSRDVKMPHEQLVWANGYDQNWVLKAKPGKVQLVASLFEPESKRRMEVYTDMPGLQLYSGNYIEEMLHGKGGSMYAPRHGVCFETQFFPNAINMPEFAQPILRQGETFSSTTIYKFMVEESDV